MITLPFSTLPNTSKLFDDYCIGASNAKRYFIGHFSDLMAYETHLQILENRTYQRENLCAILERQNIQFKSSEKTQRNISLLKDSRTCAVVTGQQVGLFTGPLYTIYKALTAVHHAQWLKLQFPAYEFVPVFWLESEDHDLEEVSHAGVIDKENNFKNIRYGNPPEEGEKNYFPVGSIPFDGSIKEVLDTIKDSCSPTDFTESVISKFQNAYHEDKTFTNAFVHLFNSLYPDLGLIFLDPSDPEIKKIYAPIIQRELETFPTAGEEVIQRSAELELTYHAQVKPRAVNLFYFHKDGRYAIEPSEYGFFLRGTRQRFLREELRAIAQTSPELFSLNVLLRPIAQDYLLPTVAYIAGPAEVAYFAQLQPVYDQFEVPMPIIFPRASITLIEPKIQKLFDKFSIEFTSMFQKPDEIYKRIVKNNGSEGLAEVQNISTELEQLNGRLKSIAEKVDQSLINAAETTVTKMKGALSSFEQRLIQSTMLRDQTIQRQLEKMQMYLNPEGIPQERQLNIFTFLNRYGFEILDLIDKSCEPFPAEHRIVHIF